MTTLHFTEHFIDELGWDYFLDESNIILTLENINYTFIPIAQKRGFGVFLCALNQSLNDDTLIKLAKNLKVHCYENFIIFLDNNNGCFLWLDVSNKTTKAHYKHFSLMGREYIVSLLSHLNIPLDQEKNIYLSFVVNMIRTYFQE